MLLCPSTCAGWDWDICSICSVELSWAESYETHRRSDHIRAKRREGEEEKGRGSTLEEDILSLMSAPPLGGISLTFTVCWTAATLFSVFPFFQSIPSLLPITQSAFHLLSVHFSRFCCRCSCSCLIAPMLYATFAVSHFAAQTSPAPAVVQSSPVFWREQNLTR